MTSQGYRSMEDATAINMDEISLFIVGKTGNGKSSLGNHILGNHILGKPKFQVSTSMASETTRMSQAVGVVNGQQIKVIDTPDPVNLDLSDAGICAEVTRWKSLVVGKFAILLAVRCDVRYTAEEYDIYKKIKKAWRDNKSFTSRLVVVFTFGDRQDRDIREELKTVCWELRSVLNDADNRYVIFNNQGFDSGPQVRQLINIVDSMFRQHSPRFNKYLLGFVSIIIILALWFGIPWRYNELKTPVFFAIFVGIGVGIIAFVYRRRLVTCINFTFLM